MKIQTLVVLFAGTLASPLVNAGIPGYLTDAGSTVVRNGYGECWHTGSWTPDLAVVGCDGVMAAAAPPEPKVTAPPPRMPEPRVVRPLVLDASTHFAFDSAELKPAAKDKLDTLVREVRGKNDVQRIRITGHADRIGDESYNRDLSLRRAESVKAYLLQHAAVEEARIETLGMGESQPLVGCKKERGAELVACLAPNRRVEVVTEVQ